MSTNSPLFDDDETRDPSGDPARFGGRWRLVSAGLSNVWRYGDLVLPAASGRLLLRGPNGTGKTTALEALWPFLLDLDKTKLRAGQSRTTTLTSLMREGWTERRRVGYAWLTFAGPGEEATWSYGTRLVLSNGSTPVVRMEPFAVPGRPLVELALTGPGRTTLTTAESFRAAVEDAGGQVFVDEHDYVTHLGGHVFDATRSDLLALADRIRTVRNPSLLAVTSADAAAKALREALPGVSAEVVESTGQALAATEETRSALERDEQAAQTLRRFAEVWAGHAVEVAGRTARAADEARRGLEDVRRALARESGLLAEADSSLGGASQSVADNVRTERDASAEVSAIEKSPAYQDAGRLADRRSTALAEEREAESKTTAVTLAADRLRRDTDQAAHEADQLVREVASTCADAMGHDRAAETVAVIVRRPSARRLSVGEVVVDPGPGLTVAPEPERLDQVRRDWTALATAHATVAAAAELLLGDHRKVVAPASARVSEAVRRAEETEREAERDAQRRDRSAERMRSAAQDLAHLLRAWLETSTDLTADAAEDPLSGEVVHETAAGDASVFLVAADTWARAAQDRAASRAVEWRLQSRTCETAASERLAVAADFRRRADELRSGILLPLPRPAWAGTGDDRRAFGGAVEWTDVESDVRDHVESALAAAGMLGATLDDGGAQTLAWSLRAGPPCSGTSLAALLRADPDHPYGSVAEALLAAVRLADTEADADGAEAVVGRDGTFRFGVLRGRSPGTDAPDDLPAATHIGAVRRRDAALREAARLSAEAERAETEADRLRSEAAGLAGRADDVRRRAADFPARTGLERAESARVAASEVAARSREAAATAAESVAAARTELDSVTQAWAARARAMGRPSDLEALGRDQRDGAQAERDLRQDEATLARHCRALTGLVSRLDALDDDRTGLDVAHRGAVDAHGRADRTAAELAALEAAHGDESVRLVERLTEAQSRMQEAQTAHAVLSERLSAAERGQAAAVERVGAAESRLVEVEPVAAAAVRELRALLDVAGVRDAVLAPRVNLDPDAALAGDDAALVRQVVEAAAGTAAQTRKKVADEHELARASLAGAWAIDRAEGHGDALDTYRCTRDGDVMTPSAAGVYATAAAEKARQRLQETEMNALRTFIVGRLPAAIGAGWSEQRDWVTRVNRKMGTASASSGVGVRVRVSLRDDLSPAQRTVHRLACTKSAATRTTAEDDELGRSLRTMLGAAVGEDVTERVRSAVDIRDWVRVDYLVSRPGEDEPRRWTSRTGLSGGERRLVVLAPMLASVAALYDNLPRTALRLAALDEVPAEVDEHGREGLARYLAELDLDVVCTSYLWDGAPGAWDGVDAHDLEAGPDGTVVAFPMLVRGLSPLPGDPEDLRDSGDPDEPGGPDGQR